MDPNHQKIIRYYRRFESRFAYDWLLGGAKHFGFYPDGVANIPPQRAQELLQDLVAKNLGLQAGQTVLDAGCGQGVVSTYLAKKFGCHIVGITIVPFEIPRAQRLAAKRQVADAVRYHRMDYSHTSFPDGRFDAIYTVETLSHSPDVGATLREFWRIIKPGGKIALFEYTLAPNDAFTPDERRVIDRMIAGSAVLGLRDFRHDRFTRTIANAGFTAVQDQNISVHIIPSLGRLRRIFLPFYAVVKILHLQKYFVNTTVAVELYPLAERDLVRYCIFTAEKPMRAAP